ncbi:MAG: DegT/DnrJ/EryC1/StrS family aminotransferase [Planctomycetes bacterium]|nr:DegT/DnrJ/EryC1/StrS family aminotransferase [Planctomycetota bacterium]
MTIKANPFGRQWELIQADVLAAVARVGASGWYILGEEVAGFEGELAAHEGRQHAVGCASGLDAIELALRALGIQPGDRVLTTPLSAFATTLAIVRAGGVPVFCDVDAAGLLDLELAERCLSEHSEIRYAVTVNLYGHVLDRVELQALKDRHGIKLVEDCAQSIGAASHGEPAGGVGDLATLSFYPTKNLGALGDAGAVLTDDAALADRCRRLRHYGQGARYEHVELGLNSRLDELQAAILRSAFLPRLDAWTAARRAIAKQYSEGLTRLIPVPRPANSDSVWHLYPVLSPAGERDASLSALKAAGVQVNVHYPTLIPSQAAMNSVEGFLIWGQLSRAEDLAAREISLPISPLLREEEIQFVIDAVERL